MRRLAVLLAAVAALVGLVDQLAVAPWLDDRLRDDAFYEFVWAANVAGGHGPTVSAGTTTSGVQLLWTCLLVPVAALAGAEALPFVAPWLGLLLHVAAAASWRRLLRPRWLGWSAALLWLGHPLLLRESQNGQETALAVFCALQLWRQRRAGVGRFGVWAVSAVFARSDLLALVVALAAPRGWRHWLVAAAAAGSFAVANRALGGGWLPDSAAPMAWLWRENFALGAPGVAEWLQQYWWYLRPVLLGGPWQVVSPLGSALAAWWLLRPWLPRAWRWVPLAAVGAATLAGADDLLVPWLLAVLLVCWPRCAGAVATSPWRRQRARWWLAVALGAIVVVHWPVRWYPRDYYLAPVVLLAFVALRSARRAPVVVALFAILQVGSVWQFAGEPLGGQRAMELAGRHLGELVPAGLRVGSFNSGIVTYWQGPAAVGTPRDVVNLDGVVDARALAALQRRALLAFVDRQRLVAIVDNPRQFASDPRQPHACGPWFAPGFVADREFVPVGEFRGPGSEPLVVFARRDPAHGGPTFAPPAWPAPVRVLGRDGRAAWVVGVEATAGQELSIGQPDGRRKSLLVAPYSGRFVVAVPPADRGTGELFVDAAATPALVLPRL